MQQRLRYIVLWPASMGIWPGEEGVVESAEGERDGKVFRRLEMKSRGDHSEFMKFRLRRWGSSQPRRPIMSEAL